MIRGTTPTIEFEFPYTIDFVKNLRVSFAQNGAVKVEKTKDDVELVENRVVVKLSQEDTLSFSEESVVKIQLKVLTTENDVLATEEYSVMVRDILNEEILE